MMGVTSCVLRDLEASPMNHWLRPLLLLPVVRYWSSPPTGNYWEIWTKHAELLHEVKTGGQGRCPPLGTHFSVSSGPKEAAYYFCVSVLPLK